MTKIYCADHRCKYCKNNKCMAKEVNMSSHSVNTLYQGRQDFLKCKTFEKSEECKEFEKLIFEYIKEKLNVEN